MNISWISQLIQPNLDGIYWRLLSSPTNILSLFFIPIIALIPDMTLKYFKQLYFPDKADIEIKNLKLPKFSAYLSSPQTKTMSTQVKISNARRKESHSRS
mmetsp:Transcript_782/g.651  ORF Transcript_782/g.651 Transcript_782/m.651 type:complete len:100 (+) Transcript_782:273-572(+)